MNGFICSKRAVSIVVRKLMIYALAVGHIYYVLVCVQKDLLSAESWKLEVLCRVFSHFVIDLLLEFFEFSLYVLVDVSYFVQEMIVVVLVFLVFVENVLAVLSDVVDRALNHPCLSHVLTDGIVPVDLTFSGHHRQVLEVLNLISMMNIRHISSVLQFIQFGVRYRGFFVMRWRVVTIKEVF